MVGVNVSHPKLAWDSCAHTDFRRLLLDLLLLLILALE